MAIEIKLKVFQGPLDLLLHLIEKNKLNIYDIPIVEITEQYLQYLSAMEKFNMEITSEFLVMAATLLNIKAKMLLPAKKKSDEDDEEDPREELVRKLLEYKKYKYASYLLKDKLKSKKISVYKKPTIPEKILEDNPIDIQAILQNITLEQLYGLYIRLMAQFKNKIDPIRSTFNAVQKDKYTVQEKINFLLEQLNTIKIIKFNTLIADERANKSEKITYFLAVLELIKMNKVIISQKGLFDDIDIELKGGSIINEH